MVEEVSGAVIQTAHSMEVHIADEGHIDGIVRRLLRERWGDFQQVATPRMLGQPKICVMEIRNSQQFSAFGAVSFCFPREMCVSNLAFLFDKLGNIVRLAAFSNDERVVPYLFRNQFIDIGDTSTSVDGGTVYSRSLSYPTDIPRCVIVDFPN